MRSQPKRWHNGRNKGAQQNVVTGHGNGNPPDGLSCVNDRTVIPGQSKRVVCIKDMPLHSPGNNIAFPPRLAYV